MFKISAALLLCFIIGCSSSPRYVTGKASPIKKVNNSSKNSKTKKNNQSEIKHRRIMKGVSSFYAEDFHGKLTANGEVYDMYGVTAAHKTLPLNTVCRVTNLKNDKSLKVDISHLLSLIPIFSFQDLFKNFGAIRVFSTFIDPHL